MKASLQLATRFREVILNGKWIANTNIQEQLKDVDLAHANTKVANLNTIALLTFHLNYYIAGVLEVFKGGKLNIRDKHSFDMPILKTKQDWSDLKRSLMSNAEEFAKYVESMSDKKLDEDFVKPNYGDYRRNIEGIIEHSYYHFGQIVLIKKLIRQAY